MFPSRSGRPLFQRVVVLFLLVLALVLAVVPSSRADGGLSWEEAFSPPHAGRAIGLDGPVAVYSTHGCQPRVARSVASGSSLYVLARESRCNKMWYQVRLADGMVGWMRVNTVDTGALPSVTRCRYSGGNDGTVTPYLSPRRGHDHSWVRLEGTHIFHDDLVVYKVSINSGPAVMSRLARWSEWTARFDLNETVQYPRAGLWDVWLFVNGTYVGGCRITVLP